MMKPLTPLPDYDEVLGRIVGLLEGARRASARSVNTIMTATYWEIGRQIVEGEQKGISRAEYRKRVLERLSKDLTVRFGRGFGVVNLTQMRRFYLTWPQTAILQTPSEEFVSSCDESTCSSASEKTQTPSAESPSTDSAVGPEGIGELIENPLGGIRQTLSAEFANPFVPIGCNPATEVSQAVSAKSLHLSRTFALPWSHYVKLLTVEDPEARAFYETEALRGGWSVRQLDRQISSKFYERTLLSRNKAAMLRKGEKPLPADAVSPEEEIKDPLVLEFLGLKDEYSETELEESLIRHLESFLLELGGDFAFVGRQRRLRIGNAWYRIDLLFFHRRLRCLLIIDLKLGMFTHADAGQMHLYLNYAREHWMHEHENPPVGLILCSQKDEAVAHYALDGLPNKVLASQYKMALPDEQVLIAELKRTQNMLTSKGILS
jgi:predicted nuclease of restriction endonuclease-like (RecB) superfamily